MKNKIPEYIPKQADFINPTIDALHELGGSGKNDEIYDEVIKIMNLPDEAIDYPHLGSERQTEVQYKLAWARTYLKAYGILDNSERSVWIITPEFRSIRDVDAANIMLEYRKKSCNITKGKDSEKETDNDRIEDEVTEVADLPDEVKPWRKKLYDVLMNMDPFAFERLAQRVLRECGFTQVEVTKKTGDGGIDGVGKLKINGIFSFNIAFQCKRYKGSVGAPEIRDFRGSLTTNIEKGVFITTGTFTKSAKEEAASPGKQQIDLMDGEEFINKLVEYRIGVREIRDYEIIDDFFESI